MFALIGRVQIKPERSEEALGMIASHGVPMIEGMPGALAAYWSRNVDGSDIIQHLFWVFDTEANARAAEAMANTLRNMPEAPAIFISADVTRIIGSVQPVAG
jgi:hypothetical protein